jgi:hypothetical protein
MFLPLALLAAVLPASGRPAHPHDVTVTVTVDSSRHEVHIHAGPFTLPNMGAMSEKQMMDLGMSHDTPVYHFTWPVQGWFRGFAVDVEGSNGQAVPKRVMHHMIVVDYDRRQLIYHAAERLFGAGRETADASIPATIGIPMKPGMDLGFYVAWHNDTGKDLDGVYMNLTMQYLPPNQNPRPVDVLPLYMDVNLTVGGSNMFDVPPGRSTKSHEFTMPISGHLLGYGGHLHDYGVSVSLQDVATGKVIASVHSTRKPDGEITGVSRSLPGIRGAGVKLTAGKRYRVTAVYDNPTGQTLINGAMAHISGIFAPDDMSKWPAIDPADPDYQRDLASLETMGTDADNAGHDHDMKDMKGMKDMHPAEHKPN